MSYFLSLGVNGFVAWELMLLQIMRATGLGVVVEVGPGSTFKVGDHVTGSWGAFSVLCSIFHPPPMYR